MARQALNPSGVSNVEDTKASLSSHHLLGAPWATTGSFASIRVTLTFLTMCVCLISVAQCASIANQEKAFHTLAKRSIPAVSPRSYTQHNIMRFGRAPHNIMHFGKRSGNEVGESVGLEVAMKPEDDLDSLQQQQLQASEIMANAPMATAINRRVATRSSNAIDYVLVPIDMLQTQHRFDKKGRARNMLPEENDNLFMHFG